MQGEAASGDSAYRGVYYVNVFKSGEKNLSLSASSSNLFTVIYVIKHKNGIKISSESFQEMFMFLGIYAFSWGYFQI